MVVRVVDGQHGRNSVPFKSKVMSCQRHTVDTIDRVGINMTGNADAGSKARLSRKGQLVAQRVFKEKSWES